MSWLLLHLACPAAVAILLLHHRYCFLCCHKTSLVVSSLAAAGAAKMIADNDWRDAAAVASRRAGELYGLNVLDEDIQVGCVHLVVQDSC